MRMRIPTMKALNFRKACNLRSLELRPASANLSLSLFSAVYMREIKRENLLLDISNLENIGSGSLAYKAERDEILSRKLVNSLVRERASNRVVLNKLSALCADTCVYIYIYRESRKTAATKRKKESEIPEPDDDRATIELRVYLYIYIPRTQRA